MQTALRETVTALCGRLLRERCRASDEQLAARLPGVVGSVLELVGPMPDLLRRPVVFLTLAFDWAGLRYGGRPFRRLADEAQCRQVEAWRNSRLGFCRDLVRFYESLAVFAWYAQLHERPAA